MQLVLPLLLATAMAAFAASAWKVADDWRVSKAAATIGASTVYYTDTAPARLQWVTQQVDPEGQLPRGRRAAGPAHRRRWPGGAGRREPLRPGGRLGLAVGYLRRERGPGLVDAARRARPDPVQRVERPGGAARHRAPRQAQPAPGDVVALHPRQHRRRAAGHPGLAAQEGFGDAGRLRLRVRRRVQRPAALPVRELVLGVGRVGQGHHREHRRGRRRARRLAPRRPGRVACRAALRRLRGRHP